MDLCCPSSTVGHAAGVVLGVVLLCVNAGCSDAVTMVRETETSGVVSYLFKEERGGPMGSPHRKGALKMMEKKCSSGYVVLKEGEVQGYGSMSSVEGQEGEVTGRRWGMQFICK
ncbi:MAG: hypothetical protein H8K08_06420 [Nitrospira sp.]|jgi:hypothetical protein|nr:hypothetical protein [Nitrospira sp.]